MIIYSKFFESILDFVLSLCLFQYFAVSSSSTLPQRNFNLQMIRLLAGPSYFGNSSIFYVSYPVKWDESKLIVPFLTFVGQNAFEAFLKLLLYIISSCMNRSYLSCFMQLSNSNSNKQWCIGSWVRSGTIISKVGRA